MSDSRAQKKSPLRAGSQPQALKYDRNSIPLPVRSPLSSTYGQGGGGIFQTKESFIFGRDSTPIKQLEQSQARQSNKIEKSLGTSEFVTELDGFRNQPTIESSIRMKRSIELEQMQRGSGHKLREDIFHSRSPIARSSSQRRNKSQSNEKRTNIQDFLNKTINGNSPSREKDISNNFVKEFEELKGRIKFVEAKNKAIINRISSLERGEESTLNQSKYYDYKSPSLSRRHASSSMAYQLPEMKNKRQERENKTLIHSTKVQDILKDSTFDRQNQTFDQSSYIINLLNQKKGGICKKSSIVGQALSRLNSEQKSSNKKRNESSSPRLYHLKKGNDENHRQIDDLESMICEQEDKRMASVLSQEKARQGETEFYQRLYDKTLKEKENLSFKNELQIQQKEEQAVQAELITEQLQLENCLLAKENKDLKDQFKNIIKAERNNSRLQSISGESFATPFPTRQDKKLKEMQNNLDLKDQSINFLKNKILMMKSIKEPAELQENEYQQFLLQGDMKHIESIRQRKIDLEEKRDSLMSILKENQEINFEQKEEISQLINHLNNQIIQLIDLQSADTPKPYASQQIKQNQSYLINDNILQDKLNLKEREQEIFCSKIEELIQNSIYLNSHHITNNQKNEDLQSCLNNMKYVFEQIDQSLSAGTPVFQDNWIKRENEFTKELIEIKGQYEKAIQILKEQISALKDQQMANNSGDSQQNHQMQQIFSKYQQQQLTLNEIIRQKDELQAKVQEFELTDRTIKHKYAKVKEDRKKLQRSINDQAETIAALKKLGSRSNTQEGSSLFNHRITEQSKEDISSELSIIKQKMQELEVAHSLSEKKRKKLIQEKNEVVQVLIEAQRQNAELLRKGQQSIDRQDELEREIARIEQERLNLLKEQEYMSVQTQLEQQSYLLHFKESEKQKSEVMNKNSQLLQQIQSLQSQHQAEIQKMQSDLLETKKYATLVEEKSKISASADAQLKQAVQNKEEELKRENEQLLNTLKQKIKEVERLTKEIEATKSENVELNLKAKQLDQQLEKLKNKAIEIDYQSKKASQDKQNQIDELNAVIKQYTHKEEENKKTNSQQEAIKLKLKDESNNLQNQIRVREQNEQKLGAELLHKSNEIERIQRERQQEIEQIKRNYSKDIEQIKQNSISEQKNLVQTIGGMKEQLEQVRNEVDQMKRREEGHIVSIKEQEKQLKEATKQCSSSTLVIQEKNKISDNQAKQIIHLQQNINTLQEENDKMRQQIDTSEEQKEELRLKKADMRNNYESVISSLKLQHEEIKLNLQNQIQAIIDEYQLKEHQLQEIQQELLSEKQSKEEIEKQLNEDKQNRDSQLEEFKQTFIHELQSKQNNLTERENDLKQQEQCLSQSRQELTNLMQDQSLETSSEIEKLSLQLKENEQSWNLELKEQKQKVTIAEGISRQVQQELEQKSQQIIELNTIIEQTRMQLQLVTQISDQFKAQYEEIKSQKDANQEDSKEHAKKNKKSLKEDIQGKEGEEQEEEEDDDDDINTLKNTIIQLKEEINILSQQFQTISSAQIEEQVKFEQLVEIEVNKRVAVEIKLEQEIQNRNQVEEQNTSMKHQIVSMQQQFNQEMLLVRKEQEDNQIKCLEDQKMQFDVKEQEYLHIINQKNEQMQIMLQELSNQNEQIDEQTQQIQNLIESVSTLKQQMELKSKEAIEQLNRNEEELLRAEKELEYVKNELEITKKVNEKYNKENEEYQHLIKQLSETLSSLSSGENKKIEDQEQIFIKERQKLQSEMSIFKETVTQLNIDKGQLINQSNCLQNEIIILKQSASQLKIDKERVIKDSIELQNELAKLKDQENKLNIDRGNSRKELEELQSEIIRLKEVSLEQNNQKVESIKELKDLQNEIIRLRETVAQLNIDKEKSVNELVDGQAQKLKAVNNHFQEQIDILQSNYEEQLKQVNQNSQEYEIQQQALFNQTQLDFDKERKQLALQMKCLEDQKLEEYQILLKKFNDQETEFKEYKDEAEKSIQESTLKFNELSELFNLQTQKEIVKSEEFSELVKQLDIEREKSNQQQILLNFSSQKDNSQKDQFSELQKQLNIEREQSNNLQELLNSSIQKENLNQEQISVLQQQLNSLTQKESQNLSQLQELQKQLNIEKEQTSQLSGLLNSQTEKDNSMQEEFQELQQQLNSKIQSEKQREREFSELEKQVNTLKEEEAIKIKDLLNSQTQKESLKQKEFQQLEEQLITEREKSNQLQLQLSNLQAHLEQIQEQLQNSKEQMNKQKQEFDKIENENRNLKDQHERTIKKIENKDEEVNILEGKLIKFQSLFKEQNKAKEEMLQELMKNQEKLDSCMIIKNEQKLKIEQLEEEIMKNQLTLQQQQQQQQSIYEEQAQSGKNQIIQQFNEQPNQLISFPANSPSPQIARIQEEEDMIHAKGNNEKQNTTQSNDTIQITFQDQILVSDQEGSLQDTSFQQQQEQRSRQRQQMDLNKSNDVESEENKDNDVIKIYGFYEGSNNQSGPQTEKQGECISQNEEENNSQYQEENEKEENIYQSEEGYCVSLQSLISQINSILEKIVWEINCLEEINVLENSSGSNVLLQIPYNLKSLLEKCQKIQNEFTNRSQAISDFQDKEYEMEFLSNKIEDLQSDLKGTSQPLQGEQKNSIKDEDDEKNDEIVEEVVEGEEGKLQQISNEEFKEEQNEEESDEIQELKETIVKTKQEKETEIHILQLKVIELRQQRDKLLQEVQEFEINEERLQKQVLLLKQEIKELANNDNVLIIKSQLKTIFPKFLQSISDKSNDVQPQEAKEFLSIILNLLEFSEPEKEQLISFREKKNKKKSWF